MPTERKKRQHLGSTTTRCPCAIRQQLSLECTCIVGEQMSSHKGTFTYMREWRPSFSKNPLEDSHGAPHALQSLCSLPTPPALRLLPPAVLVLLLFEPCSEVLLLLLWGCWRFDASLVPAAKLTPDVCRTGAINLDAATRVTDDRAPNGLEVGARAAAPPETTPPPEPVSGPCAATPEEESPLPPSTGFGKLMPWKLAVKFLPKLPMPCWKP